MKTKIISGAQDTRLNGEDFAITPYIFSVFLNGKVIKLYGVGICWGYYAIYLGIGFNIPDNYPRFKSFIKK